MTESSPVITIAEAAAIARVSESTVIRWVMGDLPGTPKLPAVRVGRQWRIKRDSLDRFLSSPQDAAA